MRFAVSMLAVCLSGCAFGMKMDVQSSALKTHPVSLSEASGPGQHSVLVVQGWLAAIGVKETKKLLVQTMSEVVTDTVLPSGKTPSPELGTSGSFTLPD